MFCHICRKEEFDFFLCLGKVIKGGTHTLASAPQAIKAMIGAIPKRIKSYLEMGVFVEEEERRPEAAPATEVFSLLNKLNMSKATGLDKTAARLIRECADLICIPICDIFNQSICLGIFPDDWKCARFSPLFKQGDRDDLNNYRPISVISVVAKVFERIVYYQLYSMTSAVNINDGST